MGLDDGYGIYLNLRGCSAKAGLLLPGASAILKRGERLSLEAEQKLLSLFLYPVSP